MWALVALAIAVIGVGAFFLVRAAVRFSQAMSEVKDGLAQLGEMGPRLQTLSKDLGDLTESLEKNRPQ